MFFSAIAKLRFEITMSGDVGWVKVERGCDGACTSLVSNSPQEHIISADSRAAALMPDRKRDKPLGFIFSELVAEIVAECFHNPEAGIAERLRKFSG